MLQSWSKTRPTHSQYVYKDNPAILLDLSEGMSVPSSLSRYSITVRLQKPTFLFKFILMRPRSSCIVAAIQPINLLATFRVQCVNWACYAASVSQAFVDSRLVDFFPRRLLSDTENSGAVKYQIGLVKQWMVYLAASTLVSVMWGLTNRASASDLEGLSDLQVYFSYYYY